MTTLEKFETYLIKARKAHNTIKKYMGAARSYNAFCHDKTFDSPQDAVCAFLSTFAANKKSVTHQKGALNALCGKNGLYAAMGKPLGQLPAWVNAKQPETVPVWVTQAETEAISAQLAEAWSTMVLFMFGAGLRVGEVAGLRWRDLDFDRMTITVHQGKGNKDRVTFLPSSLVDVLQMRLKKCRALWQEDRDAGSPGVQVPRSFSNKSRRTAETLPFFWVFPAAGESRDKDSGITRRHHVHKKSLSKALRAAVRRAGVMKRVTCHSFRHGFATAYLMAGGNIRELAELLGHRSIQTTEIYTHCIPQFTDRVGSPLDQRPSVVPFARPSVECNDEGESIRQA